MKVLEMSAKNYRNIGEISFQPCGGINVIYGENAQGKTNLIEAIWLFTGCKSFRASKEAELIGFGNEYADLKMSFFSEEREQDARIIIEKKRQAFLNGIKLPSPRKLMGHTGAVIFSPVHLNLVKGGPDERRRFIDTALCQLRPGYAAALSQYNRTLIQRNALIKKISSYPSFADTLDIWDEKLAFAGAEVAVKRAEYIALLSEESERIYSGLSSGREKMGIRYKSQFLAETAEESREKLSELLKASRKSDLMWGSTSKGPHRDELEITVGGKAAKSFASQGQQRSCALSLKLSEAAVMEKITSSSPIILLDDVMSELDFSRQDYILNHIDGRQVFITCCDPTAIMRFCSGKAFEIKNGALVSDTEASKQSGD